MNALGNPLGPQAALGAALGYTAFQLGVPEPGASPEIVAGFWACAGLAAVPASRGVGRLLQGAYEAYKYAGLTATGESERDASWLSKPEAKRLGLRRHHRRNQLIVGRVDGMPVSVPLEGHCLMVGATGTGKTRNGIIPLVLERAPVHNAVILDTKREVYEATAAALRAQGVNVVLVGSDAGKINPLGLLWEMVHAGSMKARAYARMIATQLLPEPANEGNNKHFREGGIMTGVLIMLVMCDQYAKHRVTLAEFARLVNDESALAPLVNRAMGSEKLFGAVSEAATSLFNGMNPRPGQKSSYHQFADSLKVPLADFSTATIGGEVTSASDVSFEDLLGDQRTAVFISFSPSDVDAAAPVVGMLFACALYSLIEGKPAGKIDFIFEELTNSGKIRDLPKILSLLRDLPASAFCCFQGHAEAVREYGQQIAETIFSQCQVGIFYGARGYEDCKRISDMLGTYSRVGKSGGIDGNEISRSVSRHAVPLERPDEVRMSDQIRVFAGNLKPMRLEAVGYDARYPHREQVTPKKGRKRFRSSVKIVVSRLAPGGMLSLRPPRLISLKRLRRVVELVSVALVKSKVLAPLTLAVGIVWGLETYGAPHVLIDPDACAYVGPTALHVQHFGWDDCPIVRLEKTWD